MLCRAGSAACEREKHGEAWSHMAGRAQKGCGKKMKKLARLPPEDSKDLLFLARHLAAHVAAEAICSQARLQQQNKAGCQQGHREKSSSPLRDIVTRCRKILEGCAYADIAGRRVLDFDSCSGRHRQQHAQL